MPSVSMPQYHNETFFSQSEDGRTALHMTALHGRFTRAQSLIEHGELHVFLLFSYHTLLIVAFPIEYRLFLYYCVCIILIY